MKSAIERAQDELRPISFELDYVDYPEGSVLVRMGNTRVLCNATLDTNLPPWLKYGKNKHGWVTAEYAMLPRSTETRTPPRNLDAKGTHTGDSALDRQVAAQRG